MDIRKIQEEQVRLLKATSVKFKRYMHDTIEWQTQMLCLMGPRGVGKTTLMLQHIKQAEYPEKYLYYNVDNISGTETSLLELADVWAKEGGQYLVIDEIHKYPNWSIELKQIYDSQPSLQVIFTGSSILDIYSGMADLSRRAALYEMQGLSFREYLELFHNIKAPILDMDKLLAHQYEINGMDHPLPLFKDYLCRGYYPFGIEKDFTMKLRQVVLQTMEVDIPVYSNINPSTGRKLRKLLAIIADSVPFKPIMQKLAEAIGVSRNQIADYLVYMERAGMIAQLRDNTGGIRGLGKVEKIYLDNPNLCHILSSDVPNAGNLRETFFLNQMRVNYDVISSRLSDFCIGEYTFEIGGKNKTRKQVARIEKAYIVKDDIEFGFADNIPLWAIGLTY